MKMLEDIPNGYKMYRVKGRTRILREKCVCGGGGDNQRGIIWKLNMGEQSFLRLTHRLYLIHIPIKGHEDIPNGFRVMG